MDITITMGVSLNFEISGDSIFKTLLFSIKTWHLNSWIHLYIENIVSGGLNARNIDVSITVHAHDNEYLERRINWIDIDNIAHVYSQLWQFDRWNWLGDIYHKKEG